MSYIVLVKSFFVVVVGQTFAVAGFFKCISEFAAKTSLPTVDTDDEDISPLSE